jgi:hypothetical protein
MHPFGLHSLNTAGKFMCKTMKFALSGMKIYLFWITVHYLASHLYPQFCAELSVYGFITSAIYVMTPHCRALAWLKTTSAIAIENMWLVVGAWFCAKLMPYVGPSFSTSKKKRTNSDIDEDE